MRDRLGIPLGEATRRVPIPKRVLVDTACCFVVDFSCDEGPDYARDCLRVVHGSERLEMGGLDLVTLCCGFSLTIVQSSRRIAFLIRSKWS